MCVHARVRLSVWHRHVHSPFRGHTNSGVVHSIDGRAREKVEGRQGVGRREQGRSVGRTNERTNERMNARMQRACQEWQTALLARTLEPFNPKQPQPSGPHRYVELGSGELVFTAGSRAYVCVRGRVGVGVRDSVSLRVRVHAF